MTRTMASGGELKRLLFAMFTAMVLAVVATGGPAAAGSGRVLILGSTVSGGESSLEAQAATDAGYTVEVVDDDTWSGMTGAEVRRVPRTGAWGIRPAALERWAAWQRTTVTSGVPASTATSSSTALTPCFTPARAAAC